MHYSTVASVVTSSRPKNLQRPDHLALLLHSLRRALRSRQLSCGLFPPLTLLRILLLPPAAPASFRPPLRPPHPLAASALFRPLLRPPHSPYVLWVFNFTLSLFPSHSPSRLFPACRLPLPPIPLAAPPAHPLTRRPFFGCLISSFAFPILHSRIPPASFPPSPPAFQLPPPASRLPLSWHLNYIAFTLYDFSSV